ncbi:MAG TPA: tetratricopeptide repeat protein [Acidobacteriota bacterium]
MAAAACAWAVSSAPSARAAARQAQVEPRSIAERLAEARRLTEAGQIDAALAIYREIQQQQDAPFEAGYAIAWLEARRGQWKEARAALQAVWPRVPEAELGAAHDLLGRIHHQLGDFEQAAQAWQIAAARRPQDHELRFRLGTLYAGLGPARLDQAISALQAAVELAPERARYRLELGFAYENQARFEAARREYRRAAALIPEMPHAWARLGALEARAGVGELEAAEQHLRRALELDPDFLLALFQLGNLLRRQGQTEAARPYLERFDRLRRAARDQELSHDPQPNP